MTVASKHFLSAGLGLVLFVAMAAVPATAQRNTNADDLQARIDRLERDLQDLQRYTYSGSGVSSDRAGPPAPSSSYTAEVRAGEENLPATAVLTRRVDDLEMSVSQLTGQVEELTFRVNQLAQTLERTMGDVDYRLRALEGNLGPNEMPPSAGTMPGGSSRPLVATAPDTSGGAGYQPQTEPYDSPAPDDVLGVESDMRAADTAPAMAGASQPGVLGTVSASRLSGTEDADFELGMQLLRQGDFGEAESTFLEFVDAYPSSARVGEAWFWLGEARFVRGLYNDAATAYLTSARDYSGGVKAPDALLKLGMSLAALGQTQEACSAFDQVGRAYPNASDRVQRNVARERDANNCR